jgi:hypothetical protein
MIEFILLEDHRGGTYFPIEIKANNQDNSLIMTTLGDMLSALNMGIVNNPKELGHLIHKSWKEDGSLFVNEELFSVLKNACEVIKNHKIDSIYHSSDIEGVLYQYLDRYGRLTTPLDAPDLECTYVTYLCFQHNIFFHWEDDELMGYFLSRGSDIDYDKVIQKLAATKEKDVPWVYWSENNEDDNAPLSLPKQDDNTLKN